MSPPAELNLIRNFFSRVDDGSLWGGKPASSRMLRRRLGEALADLLLNHRPFLEAATGLAWPYRELEKRLPVLEWQAEGGGTAAIRREARLFLALLPFPGQWRWLSRVVGEMAEEPEVKAFLLTERKKIGDKIQRKGRQFRLRNICQILKRPNLPEEKGILRIFSLPYLFADENLLNQLNRSYLLYIEPPWGVLARHAWLRVFARMADPAIFGVGGEEDAAFLADQGGIITTRLAHGDFLEEEPPSPERDKEFDLVFNATFEEMERKRHRFMLDLLGRPPLDRLTALFIGRGSEARVETFRSWVGERGLGGRVEVLVNLRRSEVPAQLARCRVGVLTSQNENGCRCIYEYFRADLPCVVTSSMAGFNFDLINRENGIVASDAALPGAILEALSRRDFSPRAWFLGHSGSRLSSQKLNREMQALFSRLGYAWREDIVPLGSSGATRYVEEAHAQAFAGDFVRLLEMVQPYLPVELSA